MSKVWGPYFEAYDSNTRQYLLFKSPHPSPIKQSQTPALKEHVSVLLNELLKPLTISGTPVAGFDQGPNEIANESVIKAAIASIDEEVRWRVKAADSNEEALSILALSEDLRFADLRDCDPLRDKLLSYLRVNVNHSSEIERPGPVGSEETALIRTYFGKNENRIARSVSEAPVEGSQQLHRQPGSRGFAQHAHICLAERPDSN